MKGDLSGIQSFLFDIPSRGAAKALKSRSLRVQALGWLALDYLAERMALPPAQVIYNQGGNFFLLLPARQEAELSEALRHLRLELASERLALYVAWAPVPLEAFGDFSPIWRSVEERLQQARLQAWAAEDYEALFGVMNAEPPDQRQQEQEAYKKLSERLRESRGFSIRRGPPAAPEDERLSLAGRHVSLEKDALAFAFKPGQEAGPVALVVKDLPRWTAETAAHYGPFFAEALREESDTEAPEAQAPLTFEALGLLAKARSGTDKLGVLKVDVDNLGKLFRERMKPGCRSLAHAAAVSRALGWFFGGYMNTLLDLPLPQAASLPARYLAATPRQESFRHNLYVIFSGGDDFFAVGAWDAVAEFARLLEQAFRDFTRGRVSVSAGMVVVGSKFPVSRFAVLAEEAERKAKAERNRIHFLGETLSWQELGKGLEVRDLLYDLVTQPDGSLREPRALIQRVLRSMEEYARLTEAMRQQGKLHLPRYWRMRYSLRQLRKPNQARASALLTQPYEELIRRAMHMAPSRPEAPALSPAYIALGARWAEFMTKKRLTPSL